MRVANCGLWCVFQIVLSVINFVNSEVTITSTTDNDITVVDRTSSMFTALINYKDLSINSSDIFVLVNETLADNCYINEVILATGTINITCDPIENNAGRNWTFKIGRKDSGQEVILYNTYTITLTPLALDTSTDILVQMDDQLNSALIFIVDCLNITNPEYLIFRCNNSDLSNNLLSDNCTYICPNLERGSIFNASLIRLAIPIVDEYNQTFPEESLHTSEIIDLDKVTNLIFDENSTSISFDRPHGSYDEISLSCFAQDQQCSNNSLILSNSTGNCSDCTSISISSITKGVSYKCQATTMKENFPNITSDDLIFDTPLESMIFEEASQYWFSSSNQFIFNVTPQSDFEYIQSFCSIDPNQTLPCSNLIVDHEACSTVLKHNGIRGCNYQCYFMTKKINYLEISSINYTMELLLPKPNVSLFGKGSRSITIQWRFDETVYVQYYRFLLNRALVATLNPKPLSYNYQPLLPNHDYTLEVHAVSYHSSFSDPLIIRTLEEAPASPSREDIDKKILPLTNDIESTSEEYAIEIDPSLFSNRYGIVHFYRIYVRQNLTKNTTRLDAVGTYSAAMKNGSLDYLALIISLSSSKNSFWRGNEKLRILIGNTMACEEITNASIPCNGKLKADKIYKIVVSGCTNAGCTSVISLQFRTLKDSPVQSASKTWLIIVLIVVALIVAAFVVRKRKELKSIYHKYVNESGKLEGTTAKYDREESKISLSPTICEVRPKLLIEYINMTQSNEKAIYAEYKEIENMNSQNRQSKIKPKYAVYDRYSNISARGLWTRTAVRLTGKHRLHDYINANEIRSYDNKKQYIACQGPLKETCEDFWDMIVQYRIQTIIMLTKTDERNPRNSVVPISKCHQYFPTNVNQSFVFDRIVVKVTEVEFYHNSDLDIRHISVKERNNGTEHHLVHYYYTGWPDFNVLQPTKLLALIETINQHREYSFNSHETTTTQISLSPTVIHCSAGVGRTGTYIAVDTIVRLLDRPNKELLTMKLDVMGIVYQLRKDRVRMVQTKEQYMLINRCVEEQLKQTGRLDIIKRRSDTHEKVGAPPSKSFDPSIHQVCLTEQTLSSRSSSSTHETNGQRNRMNNIVRRSTEDLSNDNHHSSTEHDHNRDSTPPRPPRRTNSRPSLARSQQ